MRYQIIIFILLFGWLASPALAQSPETIADSANAAYQRGDYYEARVLYDSVYSMDYHSAPLYYNLANSYFKLDDIPRAILFYERALKLDPGNPDIRQNLAMARELTIDEIEKVPELFYQRWWHTLLNSASADEWATVAITAFIIMLAGAGLFFFAGPVYLRKTGFYAGLLAVIITVFSLIFAVKQHNNRVKDKAAIVFNPAVTVKSSPDRSSVDLFVLHEGTKVYILDKLGKWYEIKIDNGSVGWIQQETVEVI
ncbi:MAG: tetratricopeptide repeat protein [Bacteroidota bacterium]